MSTILSVLGTSPIDPTNPVQVRCDIDRDGDIDGNPDAPAPGTDFAALLAAFGVELNKLESPCGPTVAVGGTGVTNQVPVPVADGAPTTMAATGEEGPETWSAGDPVVTTPSETAEEELTESFGVGPGFRLTRSMLAVFDPGARIDLMDACRRLGVATATVEPWPIPGWKLVRVPAGEVPAHFPVEIARSGAFVSPVFLDERDLPLVPTAAALVRLGDGVDLAAIERAARGVDPGATAVPLESTDRVLVTFSTRFGAEALRRTARLAQASGVGETEPEFLVGAELEEPNFLEDLPAARTRLPRAAIITNGKLTEEFQGLPIREFDVTDGSIGGSIDRRLASWAGALLGMPAHPMIPNADEALAIRCFAAADHESPWMSRTSWLLRANSLADAERARTVWIPLRIAGDEPVSSEDLDSRQGSIDGRD